MTSRRFETLESQLYNRLPLIGGWLRQRAARALARERSVEATQILAEAVARSDDPRVKRIALEALSHIDAKSRIDATVAVWVATRHPELAALLVEQGWVAQVPVHARVLSALKQGRLEVVTRGGAEVVEPLLLACQDADPGIAGPAQQALRQLERPEAQDALCRMVIQQDIPAARQAALAAGFVPRDTVQRALYFFMTEQWAAYQALDFDQSLLRAAYEAAGPELRRRIMEKLRAAGRTDYLTVVAGRDYRARASVMTGSETEFLVRMLANNQEWPRLWALVTEVPLLWSARIVQMLAASGWQPENQDERYLLEQMAGLAAAPLTLSETKLLHSLPPAVPCARARVVGRINDVAFSPGRPVLAVGTAQRRLVVWNFQQAAIEQVLGGFQHSVGRVVFTDGGAVLGAERSHTRLPCAIYGWRNGSSFKLGEHRGSVTSLEACGEHQVLSTGRDQRVVVWDIATGRPAREWYFHFWPRATRISADGSRAALLHNGVTLVSLPELQRIHQAEIEDGDGVSSCAAFTSGGQEIVLGKFNGQVIVHDLARRKRRGRKLLTHRGRVQGLEVRRAPTAQGTWSDVIISAGSEGTLQFMRWPERTPLGSVTASEQRLTSLHMAPDGAFMAVGTSDASLSLWDLRTLEASALFTQPLAQATPAQLAVVRVLAAYGDLPSDVRLSLRYLEQVLLHRFRYEIDIDELPTIKAGEFDIEIE